MLRVAREGHELADEVRAAGATTKADAFHRKIGVRVKELGQHPLDLHAGCKALERDALLRDVQLFLDEECYLERVAPGRRQHGQNALEHILEQVTEAGMGQPPLRLRRP